MIGDVSAYLLLTAPVVWWWQNTSHAARLIADACEQVCELTQQAASAVAGR